MKSSTIINHVHFNNYGSYVLNITRKRILNMKQKFTSIFLRFYSSKYGILNMFLKHKARCVVKLLA